MKGKKETLRKFNSPIKTIDIGGIKMASPDDGESIAEQTSKYLSERRKRRLGEAEDAELDLAAEQSKTEAARQRKERELIESGRVNPKGEEETVEKVNKQVEEAATVAAEAAKAGVAPAEAAELATGKSRIVVIEKTTEGAKTGEEMLRERAEVIEQAKALYCSCIDAGGDPKRCADMVAGLIPSQPGASSPPATSVTELIDALVKLDALRGANADMTGLKASFDNLAAEIREGRGKGQDPLDPVAFAKQQASAFLEWKKVIDEVAPPPSATGETLDVVKEKNRHAEAMETIKDEGKYKESISTTLSEIPERIGYGAADRFARKGKVKRGAGDDADGGTELETMICTEKDCGTTIYYTPESDRITCPECRMVYSRKKKSEEEPQ